MQKETSFSIHAWAQETFSAPTAIATASRALLEVAELQSIVVNKGATPAIREEVADVAIMVVQCAINEGVALEKHAHQYAGELNRYGKRNDVELVFEISRHFNEYVFDLFNDSSLGRRENLFQCYLRLLVMARRNGAPDLWALMTEKMKVNRERSWVVGPMGITRHAEEVTE